MTRTPIAERLAGELSVLVFTTLGFEHPTFRLQGERSNPLRPRCGLVVAFKGQRIAEQFYQYSLLGFHYDLTAFECDPRNQSMAFLVLL